MGWFIAGLVFVAVVIWASNTEVSPWEHWDD